jgi:hypothetical protein
MATAGWAKANATRRGELAIAWLREVDQRDPEDATATEKAGKIVVEFWVTPPSGENPKRPPRRHHRVTFEADGSHGTVEDL